MQRQASAPRALAGRCRTTSCQTCSGSSPRVRESSKLRRCSSRRSLPRLPRRPWGCDGGGGSALWTLVSYRSNSPASLMTC
eukprot:11117360-Prorocentrum_lima.AAC.1